MNQIQKLLFQKHILQVLEQDIFIFLQYFQYLFY